MSKLWKCNVCGYIHEGMISDYHVNDVKTYFMGKSLRN